MRANKAVDIISAVASFVYGHELCAKAQPNSVGLLFESYSCFENRKLKLFISEQDVDSHCSKPVLGH